MTEPRAADGLDRGAAAQRADRRFERGMHLERAARDAARPEADPDLDGGGRGREGRGRCASGRGLLAAVSVAADVPGGEVAQHARGRQSGQPAVHLLVDRHHGREAAGADAGDALDGELAGGIGVLVAGQAEAPPQLRPDMGGPGHVTGRAFADADDVLADGALAELPVERGDARDLRRRHLARAGHLPQRLVRQEAVARLDGLEHRDDGLRLPALRLENPVHGAEIERRALARRHERQDRRLELPRFASWRAPFPATPAHAPGAGRSQRAHARNTASDTSSSGPTRS